NQASNCVQVGPDCTCVKSRMRTPVSALPSWPKGLLDGLGRPLPLAFFLPMAFAPLAFAAGLRAASFTTLRADFFAAGLDLALDLAFAFFFAFAICFSCLSRPS